MVSKLFRRRHGYYTFPRETPQILPTIHNLLWRIIKRDVDDHVLHTICELTSFSNHFILFPQVIWYIYFHSIFLFSPPQIKSFLCDTMLLVEWNRTENKQKMLPAWRLQHDRAFLLLGSGCCPAWNKRDLGHTPVLHECASLACGLCWAEGTWGPAASGKIFVPPLTTQKNLNWRSFSK